MKIFRLFFIIPTLLFIVGLGVLLYLFKDGQIKSLLEEQVPGLSITKLNTNLNEGELLFTLGGDFNEKESNQNLLKLETATGSLDFHALGLGSYIVPKVELDNLVIQPELFESLSSSKSDNILSSDNSSLPKEGDNELIPGFDLENFDRREWLERFTGERELASEKHIKSIQSRAKEIKKLWDGIDGKEKDSAKKLIDRGQSMIKDWKKDEDLNKIKTKINSLKKDFESLKGQKFDKDNIAGLLNNVEKIKNLKKSTSDIQNLIKDTQTSFKSKLNYVNEVKDKAKYVSSLPKKLQGDINGFQKDLKNLPNAIKTDKELLKKELNFKNLDTTRITRLLFGKEWSDELKTYLDLWYQIQSYLPASDEEAKSEPIDNKEIIAEAIQFKRNPALPDWALKHLTYTGRTSSKDTEEIVFQGNVKNISSHEELLGESPSFDMTGKIAGSKGGSFNVKGKFSNTHKSISHRFVAIALQGRKLENKIMGKGSSQIIIEKALLASDIHLDLSKVPYMKGTISITLKDPSFRTGEKVKPMVRDTLIEALNKTFTEPLLLTFEYQQGWDSPKLKVEDRLDKVFKDAASSLVSSFANEQQDKLMDDLSKKMNGKSASMLKGVDMASLLNGDTNKSLSNISQSLLSNLNVWNKSKSNQEKDINQQQNLLDQLLGSMTEETGLLGQQQKGLENQAKSMIEDKLKEKLFGGSKEKKEEGSTDLKKEVKSIEKAFKGLF